MNKILQAFVAFALSITATAGIPGFVEGEELPSLAPMLERVTPAIVNISVSTNVQVRNSLYDDPFFRRFFRSPQGPQYRRRTRAAGSGVVVDAAKGYIITNHHVIDRADEITVGLADGRTLEATLIGADAQVDLAVLQVAPEDLVAIKFANSSALRVGDFSVAIGNPFGLNQTVTSGIISALERSGLGIEGYEDFIQTDASINPGNSGGALVDLRGHLIGINTAILAPSGGNIGIGFAIPSNMVRAVMDELIEHQEVRRGYLGLSVQNLTQDLAEAFGVNFRDGVVVVDVQSNSLADKAGIQSGDIITQIGDRVVENTGDFHSHTAIVFVGDKVKVQVRRDGINSEYLLVVDETSYDASRGERIDQRLAGVNLQNFQSDEGVSAGVGVLVTAIKEDSRAWRSGLRVGDIIVEANRTSVRSLDDLGEGARRSKRQILLRVYRAGEFGIISIR